MNVLELSDCLTTDCVSPNPESQLLTTYATYAPGCMAMVEIMEHKIRKQYKWLNINR